MMLVHPALVWVVIASVLLTILVIASIITHRRGRFHPLYQKHLRDTGRERLFLASLSFFIAFAVVRALTFAIHARLGPFHDVSVRGLHIHHLVWRKWKARILSVIYGVAAALTLDEFALWLHLRDVYWEHEGRASVDAVFMFGALLSIGVFGSRFMHTLVREALPGRRRSA